MVYVTGKMNGESCRDRYNMVLGTTFGEVKRENEFIDIGQAESQHTVVDTVKVIEKVDGNIMTLYMAYIVLKLSFITYKFI